MKRAVLIALVLVGCSKTKVKECDDLVALAEKIERCEKIPADSRKQLAVSIDTIRKTLKALEDIGDQAPKEQLEALGAACAAQSGRIRDMYEKVAPECLK